MNILKFILLTVLLLASQGVAANPTCSKVFADEQSAVVVKVRSSGARIFKLEDGRYFKEESTFNSFADRVFNDDVAGVIAFKLFQSFGVGRYIANSEYVKEGLSLVVDGKVIQTRSGILQKGHEGIETPLSAHQTLFGLPSVHSKQIHNVLNSGDWSRHYANWKLIWMLLRQTDLNIANLGIYRGQVFIFDLGGRLQ